MTPTLRDYVTALLVVAAAILLFALTISGTLAWLVCSDDAAHVITAVSATVIVALVLLYAIPNVGNERRN